MLELQVFLGTVKTALLDYVESPMDAASLSIEFDANDKISKIEYEYYD